MQLDIRRNTSPPSSGSKSKPSKKPEEAGDKLSETPASAGFFSGLFFDPQDGGAMFLLNVGMSLN
jgi:hypothetical protein